MWSYNIVIHISLANYEIMHIVKGGVWYKNLKTHEYDGMKSYSKSHMLNFGFTRNDR